MYNVSTMKLDRVTTTYVKGRAVECVSDTGRVCRRARLTYIYRREPSNMITGYNLVHSVGTRNGPTPGQK